ncbi:MAG TPA: hypothetical protein VMM78_09160, partial [Thermomicrobiales bacterium]|nr:hypothetical protein [Thermomicrobiales bacterium]
MRRVRASGARFALRGGFPVVDTPFAYLCPEIDLGGELPRGVLLALAEPVEPVRDAESAAEAVTSSLVKACAGVLPHAAEPALLNAMQSANSRLWQINAELPFSRRILLGMTVVVVSGDDMVIAQAPPGQLWIRQDQALFRLPRTDDGIQNVARPLGMAARLEPSVYYTRFSVGDVVIALSSTLARRVGSRQVRLLTSGSVVSALEWLLDESDRQFVPTGHGVIVRLPVRAAATSMPFSAPRNLNEHPAVEAVRFDMPSHNDPFSDTDPLDLLSPTRQTVGARAQEISRYRTKRHDDLP